VPLLYGGTFSPWGDVLVSLDRRRGEDDDDDDKVSGRDVEGEEFECGSEPGSLHRCSWITKNSGEECLTALFPFQEFFFANIVGLGIPPKSHKLYYKCDRLLKHKSIYKCDLGGANSFHAYIIFTLEDSKKS
jgi:hypothetical protein